MQEVSRWQAFKNKIKNIKRKGLVRSLTFILIIVVIFLSTFTKWILDPSQIVWNEWLGDTILILGLGICGMVLGEGSGIDNQKGLSNGRYQTKLKEYEEVKKKVAGQNFYFNQWLILKRNRDLRMKQCDYLSRYGISYPETIIDNLTIEEVTSLTNRPLMKKINDKDIYFKKITLEQYEALKYVYEGNIKINSDNATYFFELNPKKTNRSNIEMGEVFRKQDLKINVVLKTAKILSTIALSMIWSTFTVSEASGGNGAEVAINLFSRLFSLAAGVFGGITSAVVRVNNLSDEIENKINVLNEFIFDLEHPTESGFIPKKYEELAKEEYDKQVEEDKKAIENLVTDEDIPSIDILRIKGGENDEA